jgi:hypothetical protein
VAHEGISFYFQKKLKSLDWPRIYYNLIGFANTTEHLAFGFDDGANVVLPGPMILRGS